MRLLGILGASGLLIGVALGAFAAHMLRGTLSESMQHTFETGVRYQIYHSLAILITALFAEKGSMFSTAGLFYAVGIVLFSFSLYALALSGIKWIGAITPLGGLCFLTGHLLLFIAFLRLY
jgi:uncharacterized membrane protein YgdD (TMEM256/DUF423 family)